MSGYDPAAVMVAVARLVEITPLSRGDLTPLIVAVRREVAEEITASLGLDPHWDMGEDWGSGYAAGIAEAARIAAG